MEKSESDRILQLEKEVANLRRTIMTLQNQFKKLDSAVRPSSPRVRVIGSLRNRVSNSLNSDS